MCSQPSVSSPIHKNPISRRAEVRSLFFSTSLWLFLLFRFPLFFPLAYKRAPSFCIITTPTITQTITQINGLPACIQTTPPPPSRQKNLQAEHIKQSVWHGGQDSVISRNNMRENSKTGKTYCQSELSHMRGKHKSVSAKYLLQSRTLFHRSAQALPCH